MLTKVNDIIISMLVMSQLPIQTKKIFHSFFDVHLCPPTFQKGYSTTGRSCTVGEPRTLGLLIGPYD